MPPTLVSICSCWCSRLIFFFIIVTFQDRLAVKCLIPGEEGVCTVVRSMADIYPSMRVQAQRVQFTKPCGWNTCHSYKIVFVPVYFTESRTIYREELLCCPGFESKDNNFSCQELLVLGGTEPPTGNPTTYRPGVPGGPGLPGTAFGPNDPRNPGQPNGPDINRPAPRVPPVNPNVPSRPGNPNVPNGPGLPGGRDNTVNRVGPDSNKPNSPGSNAIPGVPGGTFGPGWGPNSPNGPIQPGNPLAPVQPSLPKRPVQPGLPGGPGPSSNPIGPGVPGIPNKPLGPGSPNVPPRPSITSGPGLFFPPDVPVLPDTVPGSQTERLVPFNPQAPVDPQYPFDPYNPSAYPREDPMNRGGSNPRTNPDKGEDRTKPEFSENDGNKDTKYDSEEDDKDENYAPSDSKGSVMVIFGVLMLVMALFALGALGMAFMRLQVNAHEELEEETPRKSITGSDKDELMPSDSVQPSGRPHTVSLDGPVTGRVNSVSRVSTCTDNDTDSGIVRISVTDETLPDEITNAPPWKNPEARRTPARNKLRLELKTKFASFLGPYSFTDLRSIHEDTPPKLSSASSERCLCNLPPTICPRPHSPIRKTANFFSSNESIPQDPPELMAYAYTAVDPAVGLSLSNVLRGKRNSLPGSEVSLNHEYGELERYDKMNNGEELSKKKGYDKLDRSESKSLKPELKPKPRAVTRCIANSASVSEINMVGYNLLSRGAEQIIRKCPTMETSYGKLDDDRRSLIKSVPSTKPKPVVPKRPQNSF